MKLKLVFILLILFGFYHNADSQQISAMSFNIRYDNPNDGENQWSERKESAVSLISEYDPNFIGIQEGLIPQLGYIDNGLQDYTYIGVGRDDGAQKGEYTAIFYDTTKFSLIEQNTFWLSKTPDEVSVGWNASMERICTYGHFTDRNTGKNIYVFNTHFDHIGRKARNNSSKLILLTIKRLGVTDSCLIVMGDFNSLPNEKPIKILSNTFDIPLSLNHEFPKGPWGTYNGFNAEIFPTERIDYIFSKNLSLNQYLHINAKRISGLCVSDHLPVFATFNYK